jgi:hypothetical protein
MIRYIAGGASALALLVAGFFVWRSRAAAEDPVPRAPVAAAAYASNSLPANSNGHLLLPPAASERSKEEKRFARADKDNNGRITLAELLEPRRKAFAKLDKDGNGQLSFDEWAAKTETKFAEADDDRSGFLTAAEYAETAPRRKPKPVRCAC